MQAGIIRITYVEPYDYEQELEDIYWKLAKESGILLEKLDLEIPR